MGAERPFLVLGADGGSVVKTLLHRRYQAQESQTLGPVCEPSLQADQEPQLLGQDSTIDVNNHDQLRAFPGRSVLSD